jgi:hypothetical protein
MRQIQVFCPGRSASERVHRRSEGFGIERTDRSRASSPRIEILTDLDFQLSMFPSFQRSTQVRSAWRDDVARVVAEACFEAAHAAPKTSTPSETDRADAVQRLTRAC